MSMLQNLSYASAIVARPGGGQATATPLEKTANRVTTVAVANDSVRLPPAAPGKAVFVKNTTANSLNVFPAGGEVINAAAANAAFAVATVKACWFICCVEGVWETHLSA